MCSQLSGEVWASHVYTHPPSTRRDQLLVHSIPSVPARLPIGTHHQLVRRVGKVLVINPGSAGEARDQGNGLQLSCAMLDTASEEVVVTDYPEPRISPPRQGRLGESRKPTSSA